MSDLGEDLWRGLPMKEYSREQLYRIIRDLSIDKNDMLRQHRQDMDNLEGGGMSDAFKEQFPPFKGRK